MEGAAQALPGLFSVWLWRPAFYMNTATNAVHSRILTVPAGAQSLGRGGFAFMRVVEQASPGLYRISLGGRLMEARSNLPLEPGSFLRVQLRAVAGQLQLVPESVRTAPLPQMARFTEGSFQSGDIPQRLAQSLASLGLPVDGVSGRLFSLMQQLGLRLDSQRMRRAYRIASHFPGRESQAAEVALMLLEKGMEADSVMVASLLSMMLGDGGCFGEGGEREAASSPVVARAANDFGGLETLVEGLYGRSVASLGGRGGLLTMLNHVASSTRHWLVVPFSMSVGAGRETAGLLGAIRLLFDLDFKKMLRICVSAQSATAQYAFMVHYGGRSVVAVEYAGGGPGWQRALEGLFPGVPVEGRPLEGLGLFCEPLQELASCNLEV